MATNQEVLTEVERILEYIKQSLTHQRDLDRLEGEVRQLRDHLVELKTLQDSRQSMPVDLRPLQKEIAAVSATAQESRKMIHEVNRKSLPITSYVTAFGVILAVLGLSYYDIRRISEPIETAGANVEQAASSLLDTTQELQKASAIVAQQQEELSTTASNLSKNIGASLTSLGDFDRVLAQILAETSRIQSSMQNAADQATNLTPDTSENNPSRILDELLESMGEDLPREMALQRKAQKELDNGEYELARQLATEAREIDPDKSITMYDALIANSYYQEGRFREAIGAYQSVIDRDPTSSFAHNNIGSSYYRISQATEDSNEKKRALEASERAHRKALEVDPSNVAAVVNASISINALGRPRDALQVLQEYKGTPSPHYFIQRAASHALLGHRSQAIADLNSGITKDPKTALLVASDADFRSLRGDQAFEKLLESYIGDQLMQAVRETWAEMDKAESEPGSPN